MRPLNYAIYARLHENFINLLILFAVTSIYEWIGLNFFNKLVPFRNSELMCGKKRFFMFTWLYGMGGYIEWVDKRFKSSELMALLEVNSFFLNKKTLNFIKCHNFQVKPMPLQWWVSHVKINTNQFNACKSHRECFFFVVEETFNVERQVI